MANVTYQIDNDTGRSTAQSSTAGAADVNVASGAVGIDPTANAVGLTPNATSSSALSNATTTVYAASLIVKAAPGKLYGFSGFNSKGSAQWIQVFDAAGIPSEAAIPKIIVYAAATANFSLDLGLYGRTFANGIVITNSSTGPTKTIGSADVFVDVQYV